MNEESTLRDDLRGLVTGVPLEPGGAARGIALARARMRRRRSLQVALAAGAVAVGVVVTAVFSQPSSTTDLVTDPDPPTTAELNSECRQASARYLEEAPAIWRSIIGRDVAASVVQASDGSGYICTVSRSSPVPRVRAMPAPKPPTSELEVADFTLLRLGRNEYLVAFATEGLISQNGRFGFGGIRREEPDGLAPDDPQVDLVKSGNYALVLLQPDEPLGESAGDADYVTLSIFSNPDSDLGGSYVFHPGSFVRTGEGDPSPSFVPPGTGQ